MMCSAILYVHIASVFWTQVIKYNMREEWKALRGLLLVVGGAIMMMQYRQTGTKALSGDYEVNQAHGVIMML